MRASSGPEGGSPRPGEEGRGRRGVTIRRRSVSDSDNLNSRVKASGTRAPKLGPAPSGRWL